MASIIPSGRAMGIDAALEGVVDNHDATTAILVSAYAIDDGLVLYGTPGRLKSDGAGMEIMSHDSCAKAYTQ